MHSCISIWRSDDRDRGCYLRFALSCLRMEAGMIFDAKESVGLIGAAIVLIIITAWGMRACDQNHEARLKRFDACAKAGGYLIDNTDRCVVGPEKRQ